MAYQPEVTKYEHIAQNKPKNQEWISDADLRLIIVDVNIDEYLRAFQSQYYEKR
jgi:hypothetical protein